MYTGYDDDPTVEPLFWQLYTPVTVVEVGPKEAPLLFKPEDSASASPPRLRAAGSRLALPERP